MKILFMGGKRIGCGCLQYLIASEHKLVGVVINSCDVAANRWYPSACELALRYDIPVFEWTDVNSPDALSSFRILAPDIIIVIYFNQILKRQLINIPSKGCINLHLALAEEYRGCYPTTWALLNDKRRTGVTLHYIDESIDGGDIIAECEVLIEDDDTGRSLYEKCTDAGIQLFSNTLPAIVRGTVQARPQDRTKGVYHRRVFPSQEVDFNKSGREIYNHIRATLFEPYPPPYFYIGEQKYEIKKAIK